MSFYLRIGHMKKPFHTLLKDDEGQAVVEYVLMIVLALGVVGIVGVGFRRIAATLWETFTRDITAACPGCPADPRYRIK